MAKDVDRIIYTHVSNQHPDSLRFLRDCEALLGREIEILKSSRYESVEDVIDHVRYINGTKGAPCSKWLKREVRREWERKNFEHHTYVWGFDINEVARAKELERTMSDYDHEFPLIEHRLSKADCHGMALQLGLIRPKMYELGYPNNNCIGCVKGGMGYWNKIRYDFPEVFERRARQERAIGHSCINGIYLDELEPGCGNLNKEVMPECGIDCYLAMWS